MQSYELFVEERPQWKFFVDVTESELYSILDMGYSATFIWR